MILVTRKEEEEIWSGTHKEVAEEENLLILQAEIRTELYHE